MGQSLQILKKQVEGISYNENIFYIPFGEGKYIFGYISPKNKTNLDMFAIKTIYDSIIDLDNKIKFSFNHILDYNPSENLSDHKPFSKPDEKEAEAIYYVENIVFRTSILWDMLAQLCNIYWKTNIPIDSIYYKTFFNNASQGKKAKELAKDVTEYLNEEDKVKGELDPWEGNHVYVKEYRNQMTHQNSPNVSTLSNVGMVTRPPVIYVVKRVVEDYLAVSFYIQSMIDEIIQQMKE
ncbi:Cthe_2314 family HEPN domain-containing protein [Salinicoccus roseus]|uniref:Cthe_2314 family HEPN domain-containing protein n=1 Tax=Salinicoccus roseus TaxID=45670 RepID=UPI001EF5E806|nr:Cthe_2314 family HEPN domain-containing protein [Salinicoccus roseus]MCG7332287.1 Cthe_2314 family HEPN domain-containing protein [Salinicoccus roseus]